jgi:hypothetical protein
VFGEGIGQVAPTTAILFLRAQIPTSQRRGLRHITAQPRGKLVEAELVCFVKGGNKNVGLLGVRRETCTVDCEKSIRGSESCALVAVDKRMVLREALPERRGFSDQVGIITGLRPVEGGFQQPLIPDALGAAISAVRTLTRRHGDFRGAEGVTRQDRSILLSVVQVLCVQDLGASGFRSRKNQGVPERYFVPFFILNG